MFGLYVAGVAGALLAALALRRTMTKGGGGGFMMELPKYQMPQVKDVVIGLFQRAMIFLKRAGTIILGTTILLWALASFPQAKPGEKPGRGLDRRQDRRTGSRSSCGRSGSTATSRWRLLPAMAAREVAVSAIATVYSIDASDEEAATSAASRTASRTLVAGDRTRPSSPGSCSRRNASRPSPSPGEKRTAGAGRCSWSAICSPSPTSRRAQPTGRRSRWDYSCALQARRRVTWRA